MDFSCGNCSLPFVEDLPFASSLEEYSDPNGPSSFRVQMEPQLAKLNVIGNNAVSYIQPSHFQESMSNFLNNRIDNRSILLSSAWSLH